MLVVANKHGFGTKWRKIMTGGNIDEFDEFPTIHQYFPYQKFTFSHLPIMNLWRCGPN